MRTQITKQLAFAALLSSAGTALAATDGTLGATSTGAVSINASVAGRVQISGLTDVAFDLVDPSSGQARAQDICVWSNSVGRKYNITARGNGTGNAFTLAASGLTPVPYSVEWAQATGQTAGTPIAAGVSLTGQSSTATAPTCTAGPATSASLIVKLAASDLQQMQAGAAYSGILTLIVAPE